MKHERILYNIIESEVRRIKGISRFVNTYDMGLLGVEMACREIVQIYYNEILETVNFVDADENYVSAILIVGGGTCKTDGSPSVKLYDFVDNISKFVVKHFTKEFIEYLDRVCDELRSVGYNIACNYGEIFIIHGDNSLSLSVTDVLYAKSLSLSYDRFSFVEIVSGTLSGKLEADVTSIVEKIMKW